MRICLHLDPSRLLRWHLWLAKALVELPGNEVTCTFTASRRPLPVVCSLLFELERLVYGLPKHGATDPVEAALLSLPRATDDADVVINLSGEEPVAAGRRVLTPLFNGVPGEIGVMAAVTNDQELVVKLFDSALPSRPWVARPASADHAVFVASLDSVLSCAAMLILKALREQRGSTVSDISCPRTAEPAPGALAALAFATRTLTSKAVKHLNHLAKGGRTWAIGWRFDQSGSLLEKGEATFSVLAGDAEGYLADPFPFRQQGQDFIFVEKYLYAKSRGCIAVATANRNGIVAAPEIVLEEPHHLSYPFVFEQDGQIWMIPESGAARDICLYRAVEFPYRWTREACLIKGIEGYDATPLRDEAGFWLFVSARQWGSTSWDVLSLYRAKNLTGSWSPHAANPVLIDAALSRPAGAFIRRGGHTLRPVQDCSHGYGSAVTFCRIDALSHSEFAQVPVGRIRSGAFGCHTYNRSCELEVIDLFGHVGAVREVTTFFDPLASDWSASGPRRPPLSSGAPVEAAP